MARAATVQALRNRGISKKTAELLADAGFTLEKLAASKIDRLAKFLPKKEAEKVLKKLGAALPEPKPAPRKERAKPAPRGRKVAAKAAEAEPETPLTIPVKAPPLTSGEQEIADGLKEIERWLPRSVMGEIAKKIHGLKLSKKRLNEVLTKICEKFDLHAIDANESAGIVSAQSMTDGPVDRGPRRPDGMVRSPAQHLHRSTESFRGRQGAVETRAVGQPSPSRGGAPPHPDPIRPGCRCHREPLVHQPTRRTDCTRPRPQAAARRSHPRRPKVGRAFPRGRTRAR